MLHDVVDGGIDEQVESAQNQHAFFIRFEDKEGFSVSEANDWTGQHVGSTLWQRRRITLSLSGAGRSGTSVDPVNDNDDPNGIPLA